MISQLVFEARLLIQCPVAYALLANVSQVGLSLLSRCAIAELPRAMFVIPCDEDFT